MLFDNCTLSAYLLIDDEICAGVFLKRLSLVDFLGNFSFFPFFLKSQKMPDLGVFARRKLGLFAVLSEM